MARTTMFYDTYTAMTVKNLQSLASDATDTFGGWQSARVSNVSTLAMDFEVFIDLSTAASAAANDKAAYAFIVPWITTDGGTTWIAGGNLGTTTLPTGAEGAATITEPNSMKFAIAMPYKDTSQRMQGAFSLVSVLGFQPEGWSLVIRNASGAALGTGCVVSYRAIKYDVA
jgi:hypothetical protein